MYEERNENQIIRKDGRNCFVEVLKDGFEYGRIHMNFAAYDTTKPAGQRQTDTINIYIPADEFLELCRKLDCGELRRMQQIRQKEQSNTPIYQCLGGTSAQKLERLGHAREDGMSLSRTMQLVAGKKTDFLFIANSGPGEAGAKGLIVPRFGNQPENHVAIGMSHDALSGMLLAARSHYQAWLTAGYLMKAAAN